MERYYSKEKVTGKLISIQKWVINRNDKSEGYYKVKFYHMDNDEFKGKLYPYSYIDAIRHLWFNRRYFRIM